MKHLLNQYYAGLGLIPPTGRALFAWAFRRLAEIRRFSGLTPRPYTVATHSYVCAHLAEDERVRLYALTHDLLEAWTGDIARPFKDFLEGADFLEGLLLEDLCEGLGIPLPDSETRAEVKRIDDGLLLAEKKTFFPSAPRWDLEDEIEPIDVRPVHAIFFNPRGPEETVLMAQRMFADLKKNLFPKPR